MKRIKWFAYAIIVALLLVTPAAVPIQGTTAIADAATIAISNKSITLETGMSKALKITGTKSKITWYSSKKTVATVSNSGNVTAKSTGEATITALVGGRKYTCKVTVIVPVKINSTALTLETGKTSTLKITGTTKTVSWSSSNKSVATVSSKGLVTAKAAGTTTITASVAGKTLTCKVTVKEPLKINRQVYTLETGKTYTLAITGTTKTVTWSSSNSSIASVDTKGKVTAKSIGKATITASVDGKKLTCVITVTDPVNPYVANAPFKAKEFKFNDSSIVIPDTWYASNNTSTEGISYINLYPTTSYTGSNIFATLYKVASIPEYSVAKTNLEAELTEASLHVYYDSIFAPVNVGYNITGFTQSDYKADFGDVFKTEYTINIMGQSIKQVMYQFYTGGYYAEVSVTDAESNNFLSDAEYILNSLQIK